MDTEGGGVGCERGRLSEAIEEVGLAILKCLRRRIAILARPGACPDAGGDSGRSGKVAFAMREGRERVRERSRCV